MSTNVVTATSEVVDLEVEVLELIDDVVLLGDLDQAYERAGGS